MVWLCVIGAYFAARKGLPSKGVFHALNTANAMLAAAPAALMLLLLCGGSPVAQMSGPGAWQFWFAVWPALVLTTLAALLVIVAGFLYHVLVNLILKRRKEYGVFLVYVVPTVLNGLLTVGLLRMAAPDA
jgi:hypothetical protein